MWVQVPSPAYDKKRTGTRTCPFLVTSRSHLNPGFKVSGLLCKPSVRRNHRSRPIRLKTAHRAVFLTPNPHLPRAEKRREPLEPMGSRSPACYASRRSGGSYAYAMPPSPDAIASVDVAASPYTSASIFTRLRASSHSENQSVCAWLIGRAISRSIVL